LCVCVLCVCVCFVCALCVWLFVVVVVVYVFAVLQSTNKQITEIGIRDNMKVFQGEQHRMWSSIVLHSGVMHLLLNSYSLKNYGPAVEQTHGKVRFLLIYLLSGWFGNSVGLRFGGMYDRSLGASGSIFGILGALVVYLWRCETEIGQFSLERPMGISPNSLVWTIGINLFYGQQRGSMFDNYAHLGGLAMGAALGFLIGPDWRVVGEDEETKYTTQFGSTLLTPKVIKPLLGFAVVFFLGGIQPLLITALGGDVYY